jgi:energy-coupling factor transporter ATP-binding protein EcfA2
MVTVSGPNGAGKSLLLEAMTFLWRAGLPWPGQFNLNPLVGPWGGEAVIEAIFTLTEDERQELTQFGRDRAGISSGDAPAQLKGRVRVVRGGEYGERKPEVDNDWTPLLLWSYDFSQRHPFARLDYMPADRTIPRGEQAQVNPSLLSEQQTESLRQQVFNSFVQPQRAILNLTGVQPFLASLDYMDMLAEREERPASGDFDAITGAFEKSTGKKINRPRTDAGAPFGAVIEVETPSGDLHGIDQLSSGEQEVLALMFFARRLSASGGLLLIDEPELHLHPALQRSLFSVLENVADRAQVWIVTHSPKLVSAAPLNAVIHMTPTSGDDTNQLTKASDEEARGELLSDLGVHPIDVLQSDMLVVVEGEMDAQRLVSILPLELSRATMYVAGGAAGVEATAATLQSGRPLVPWICIRDRDLLTDEDICRLTGSRPGIFVWPTRNLENQLLTPGLIARTLERAGVETSVDEVEEVLRAFAQEQKDLVMASLVADELKRRNPYDLREASDPMDRELAYLEAVRSSAEARVATFEDVRSAVTESLEARWDSDWPRLIDGKRTLGGFTHGTPFRTMAGFVSALASTLREEPDLLPGGFADLRNRLADRRSN